ncbi:hypothetical protein KI387_035301, partial [Taxus chinensis]
FKFEELAPSLALPLIDFQNNNMKSHVIEENIGNHEDRRVRDISINLTSSKEDKLFMGSQ